MSWQKRISRICLNSETEERKWKKLSEQKLENPRDQKLNNNQKNRKEDLDSRNENQTLKSIQHEPHGSVSRECRTEVPNDTLRTPPMDEEWSLMLTLTLENLLKGHMHIVVASILTRLTRVTKPGRRPDE